MAQCKTYVPGPWSVVEEHRYHTAQIAEKFGHSSPEYLAALHAYPHTDYNEELAALEALQKVSDAATIENPEGFILSFPVADGQALYRVEKVAPTVVLSFIPFLDAYSIPDAHLRGLRKTDVVQQIKWRDAWKGATK